MTTDLVEKCARAICESEKLTPASDEYWSRVYPDSIAAHAWRRSALAVIDALADGVTDKMMEAAAKTLLVDPSRLSPGGVDELRRALSAAIRAAKTKPEGANK